MKLWHLFKDNLPHKVVSLKFSIMCPVELKTICEFYRGMSYWDVFKGGI